jgi:hypothetical protein
MTDHTDPDPLELIEAVRAARAEADRLRRARVAGQVGYADVASAEYRAALAVQRARDAGLLRHKFSVDTSAVLGRAEQHDVHGTPTW